MIHSIRRIEIAMEMWWNLHTSNARHPLELTDSVILLQSDFVDIILIALYRNEREKNQFIRLGVLEDTPHAATGHR